MSGVGVVVHSSDGLVLVGRRIADPGQPLAIPGGKREPGESAEACAVRELAEETGLVLDAATVRTFASVLVGGERVTGVVGRLGVPASAARPQEREPDKFTAFTWIDPAARPPDIYPATAALLDALEAR